MKFILSFTIFFCLFFNGFAQKQQNVYFFKKNGKEVKVRDSADYIRIIREPDSGKVNYELVEYYKNNILKRTGEVSSYKPSLKMEGQIVSYYTNGTKQSIYNYRNNKLVDTCIRFFSNGKPEEIRYYDPSSKDSLYRIVQIYYEDGKPILDETGSGFIKKNTSKYKTVEGSYKDGRKEGVWKEYDLKKKEELEEVFVNGIFQKGISKDENGNTYAYTIKEKLPEFKGGIPAFYKFLSNKLTYPSEARSRRIQGRVVISFIVDETGKLGEFKVLKSVSSDLDTEALRVMALSPKWQPGIQNGRPVKVLYSVPIMFSLATKN
jgi:TonB family protein